MMCGCSGCKSKKLGPVSLALAVGLTSGLASLVMALYPHFVLPSNVMWHDALMMFLRGLGFGFFVAIFYDIFAWMKSCCCRRRDGSGCSCCGNKSPEVK